MKFINKYAIFLTVADLRKALLNGHSVYPYYENKHGKLTIAYSCGHAEYDKTANGNMNAFTFSSSEIVNIVKHSPNLRSRIINLAPLLKFHLTMAYQKQGKYNFITVHDKFDNPIFTFTGIFTCGEFRFITINAGVNKGLIDNSHFTDNDLTVILFEIQHIYGTKITATFIDIHKWFNLIIRNPKALAGKNFPVSMMNGIL